MYNTAPPLTLITNINPNDTTINYLLGASICVQNGTAAYTVLQSGYQKIQLQLLPKKWTVGQVLSTLTTDPPSCAGAVVNHNDWNYYSVSSQANPYCSLVQVGTNIRTLDAGNLTRAHVCFYLAMLAIDWASKHDSCVRS